jgi:hypothetical protein
MPRWTTTLVHKPPTLSVEGAVMQLMMKPQLRPI